MARQENRKDPERHKAQMRAMARARHLAENDLVSLFRSEFDAIYERIAAEEGVAAYGPKQRLDLSPEEWRARRTQQKRESRARLRAKRAEDPVAIEAYRTRHRESMRRYRAKQAAARDG